MNFPPVLFVLMLALVATASAQFGTAIAPGDVVIDKILPEVVQTPEYNLSSGPKKRSKNAQWLEVEVEYTTKPEMIDELTFSFTILINGKKLVNPEVTHIAIPKGREHYSVVYVAPRSLEVLTGGRPLTSSSIENIQVDISRQGQQLATKSFKPSPMPNVPAVSGVILKKPETPFAPLFWDRYEALKTAR